MERKNCTRCNVEKNNNDFYNKYSECKICDSNRSLKGYYENTDKFQIGKKYLMEKQRKVITKTKHQIYNL